MVTLPPGVASFKARRRTPGSIALIFMVFPFSAMEFRPSKCQVWIAKGSAKGKLPQPSPAQETEDPGLEAEAGICASLLWRMPYEK